jgi:hypothetical protein
MRTKLTSGLIAIVVLVFLVGSCSVEQDAREQAQGSIITSKLLTQRTRSEIEKNIYSVTQDVVVAGSSTFLFLTRFPYRGTPTTVLYCYELVPERENQWLFRGYFPIDLWDVHGTNLTCTRDISFVAESNSVSLLCNGLSLHTISSVAEIIRRGDNKP